MSSSPLPFRIRPEDVQFLRSVEWDVPMDMPTRIRPEDCDAWAGSKKAAPPVNHHPEKRRSKC